jgi:hypothetical protein
MPEKRGITVALMSKGQSLKPLYPALLKAALDFYLGDNGTGLFVIIIHRTSMAERSSGGKYLVFWSLDSCLIGIYKLM